MVILYFSRFGMLYQEKSGNPALDSETFRVVERAPPFEEMSNKMTRIHQCASSLMPSRKMSENLRQERTDAVDCTAARWYIFQTKNTKLGTV
jgi:hypothetical protein